MEPITTPPSTARMFSAPPGEGHRGNDPDNKSATPLRRQNTAPETLGIELKVIQNYNYKESDFDKLSVNNRKLKLTRILVDMGYSPEETKGMIGMYEKELGQKNVQEFIDQMLAKAELKQQLPANEEEAERSERAERIRMAKNKRLLRELIARVDRLNVAEVGSPRRQSESNSVTSEPPTDDALSQTSDMKLLDAPLRPKVLPGAGLGAELNPTKIREALPRLQKEISKEAEKRDYKIQIQVDGVVGESKPVEVQPEAEVETVRCGICFNDLPLDELWNASCKHYFCKTCWSKYLEHAIQDGKVITLQCPEFQCKRKVSEGEIKRSVTGDMMKKYRKFKRNREIAMDPNRRWCIKPNCEGVLTKTKLKRKAQCPLCSTAICWHCGDPYHRNASCEKAAAESKDSAFQKYKLLHNVKPCPNCKAQIEKNSGCNHMTCYHCKYEFCWICGSRYTKNHFAPYNILGCANMQDGECACFGDDNCFCIPCGHCTSECELFGDTFRFNPVGCTKRFFTRLACLVIMVPCCPCLAIIVLDEECCDD